MVREVCEKLGVASPPSLKLCSGGIIIVVDQAAGK